MIKSDSINDLASALSKAQGQMKKAVRNCNNPYFKSKYADLEGVWDACREALTKNGLSVSQLLGTSGEGKADLTTILMHSSGQFISSSAPLPITKLGPQEMGSNLTYVKRYALAAILGIADSDDDDAEAAMSRNTSPDHPSTQGGEYILRSGTHKGKKISELTEKQIKSWLERYDQLKAARDLIHPDVERDTQEIIDFQDSQALSFEELRGSKRENK